jgi:hypothetical protein
MKNLALAAICGVFHFEFANDHDVDPDFAVSAMEEIFFHLRNATTKERQAITEALSELKAEAKSSSRKNKKDLVKFYEGFLENLESDSDDE